MTWAELADADGHRQRNSPLTDAVTRTVEKAVANRGFAQEIALDLSRANLKLTVSEYLILNGMVVLVAVVATALISRSLLVGSVFGLASLYLPRWYVKGRERKRVAEFNEQLSDTIGIMANSLRSGYSLLQAMELVARETPPPMGEEFGRVVREVGLGLAPERALENLVRRINSDDLDLMVTAINVQHEVGGNLSRILDTIANTIRERVRIKGEIKVLTAQQSMAGYIISGLPLALTGVLLLLNPSYIMKLFTPGWYICMPICGGLGIVLGFIAIRKIVAIEV
ncbi:MAG TPA: type II secretion system F family protein [Chloroflexota bacterium]|nr:type II secretion system F family protein [Chloroflexota bacterium]